LKRREDMEIVQYKTYDDIISFGLKEDKKKDTISITLLGGENDEEVTKDQFKAIIFCCKEQLKGK
jgi:hypothetical protein